MDSLLGGRLRCALLMGLLAWPAALVAQATSSAPRGPIRYSSEVPFAVFLGGVEIEGADVLEPGEIELAASSTLVNIWTEFEDPSRAPRWYLIDYEQLDWRIEAGFGLGNGLELRLLGEHRERMGGIMDRFILEVHEAVGLDDDNRTRWTSTACVSS